MLNKKDDIKRQVSIEHVLAHYGRTPVAVKKMQCLRPENHRNQDANPSMDIYRDRVFCRSQECFGDKGADIFELVGIMEDISDFKGQMAKVQELFHPTTVPVNGTHHSNTQAMKRQQTVQRAHQWESKNLQPGTDKPYVRYHLRMLQENPEKDSKFVWNSQADGQGSPTLKPAQLDLYQRQQVINGTRVIVCAGEKDVETVNAWLKDLEKYPDIVATCNHTGENSVKAESFSLLHDKKAVWVIGDNDSTGKSYVSKVCGLLHKNVENLYVWIPHILNGQSKEVSKNSHTMAVVGEYNDITEWQEAGGTAEQFWQLLEQHAEPYKPDRTDTNESDSTPDLPPLSEALLDYPALLQLQLPARRYLYPFLPEGGSAMMYGPRGVGKTFFTTTLAASLCTGTPFFRWNAPPPTGVLYVDGEMDLDELRSRMTALLLKPPEAPLQFLTSHYVYHTLDRDLVLTDPDVRQEITDILDTNPTLRVLILDNISCLFSGIDEDRKTAWEPVASWLIRLRHRGVTILLVHHAGKGGQQRGTSGREDSLDSVIQLNKPSDYSQQEGCHFEITFTKCRSAKGEELEPLDAKLEELEGRLAWTWKPLAVSKEEQALRLFEEGVTSPTKLAEELGISKGYASKLLSKPKFTRQEA